MDPIDTYIARAPAEYQPKLVALKNTIFAVIPTAEAQFKYQMPTCYWHENVIHFALNKHHIGLYPTPSAIVTFADELTPYKTSKGAIQIPLDQPLPLDLVRRMTEFRKQAIIEKYQL